jgi:ATP-dependent helicase/nuclease subunit A
MTNLVKHLEEDLENRNRALDIASFIVEAPAGAGKTELLTQRFLKLLDTVDAPEEIIAVTFTNKAASEMKKRIMDSFSLDKANLPAHKLKTWELANAVMNRSKRLDWKLLENPGRLRIYTIDSLSSSLARQMPLMSRFGTQPNVSDYPAIYYEMAAMRTLAALEDKNHASLIEASLSYFDNDHARLIKLLSVMLEKRDQWLRLQNKLGHPERIGDALENLIRQDMQDLKRIFTHPLQQLLIPVAQYASAYVDKDSAIVNLSDWHEYLSCEPHELPIWRGVAELLLTGSNQLRMRADKNIGLTTEKGSEVHKENWKKVTDTLRQIPFAQETLARIRLWPDPYYEKEAWQIVEVLIQLLHLAVAQLWLVFKEHGEVDFVEIAQNALYALSEDGDTPTDLALKLDYQIKHLLVDEFQDTSPTQISLIEALTQGWQSGDGRTLFLVGDPMQSIYRFRKANVGLFLTAEKSGIGNLSLIPLKLWRNNRSHPKVIHWINEAFEGILPNEDSIARGAIRYRPFVETKEDVPDSGVYVHPLLDANPEELQESEINSKDDVRQLEANKIVEIIQSTRQQNPQAKIAVLVRARGHLRALVTHIRRHHPELDFQAVEIEELANRQVVQDLLSLTKALHHLADRIHWLAILRAPWCGLTLDDLHRLAGTNPYKTIHELMQDEAVLANLSTDGQNRLAHIKAVINEAIEQQGRQTKSRWIYGVWLMLGGHQCLWDAGDVRDVQAFFERIDEMDRAGNFSIEQLEVEVSQLYAAPDANASDKLQFMTIHKSKGLEFDTVILPGLDKRPNRDDAPLVIWEEVSSDTLVIHEPVTELIVAPMAPKWADEQNDASIYDYLMTLEKERASYESARVLYVAATRTEKSLHLLGAAKLDKHGQLYAPAGSFLENLWPALEKHFVYESLLDQMKTYRNSVILSNHDIETFVPKLVRLQNTSIPEVFTRETNKVSWDKTQAIVEETHEAIMETEIGILTHRYLQKMAEEGLDHWDEKRIEMICPAIKLYFERKQFTEKEAVEAQSQVQALLLKTLSTHEGQWILSNHTNAKSEMPIEFVESGEVKKSIIDRTFIEDGVRWIIDYKTTFRVLNHSPSMIQSIANEYADQLGGYERLFMHEGLRIQKAIYFVSIGQLVMLDSF